MSINIKLKNKTKIKGKTLFFSIVNINNDFIYVDAGNSFSVLISNGVCYAWGLNEFGGLGDSTVVSKRLPVAVCGGLTFSKISAGPTHTLALTSAGVAYAWGGSYPISGNGQLGIGTQPTATCMPTLVCGGLIFSDIVAGGLLSAGITTTGAAYTWGSGFYGALGNNTTSATSTPVAVCGGLTFCDITTLSGDHVAAITITGAAYAWGYNDRGQLGDNSTTCRSTPVAVCGGLTFKNISAGYAHTVALTTTGSAYAWGYNDRGQLGDNTITSRMIPVAVCGGQTFSKISASYDYTVALTTTGLAYAWGNNDYGKLGDNTVTSRRTPVAVCGGLTFCDISAGQHHVVAVTKTCEVYTWGYNNYGQLGLDDAKLSVSTPVIVRGGLTLNAISAGELHTVAITTTGLAYAWGYNKSGELGNNTTSFFGTSTPVAVCGGLTFCKMVAGITSSGGGGFTIAITTTGLAYAWGNNAYGQLGDNTIVSKSTPVAICGGLSFIDISAGTYHSVGLTTTGAAYAWGSNTYGQLGDNTRAVDKSTPIAVCGGLTFCNIAAGKDHSVGLTTTGQAYTWGDGTYGQLGNNLSGCNVKLTPVAVCGGLNFSKIEAGQYHTVALTTTGLAYAWGYNNYGQLGDNTVTSRRTPVAVCGGLTFSEISAGASHTVALTTSGLAYTWGYNDKGQLGDNTTVNKSTPVAVCGGLSFCKISAGYYHTIALTVAGEAYAWGRNEYGQLGNTPTYEKTPVKVCF